MTFYIPYYICWLGIRPWVSSQKNQKGAKVMDLLDRLKKVKKEAGISYRKIAERSGVGYKTITNFACGYRDHLTKTNEKKLIDFFESIDF